MAKLPTKSIKEKLDHIVYDGDQRPYLGGSVIGHPCARYVNYTFHWAYQEKVESKLWRIFRIGDAIEEIIWAQLCQIGFSMRGNQIKVGGYKGHASGHIDGIANPDSENEPEEEDMLFEAKSMNHTNFLEVQRKTVQVAKPIYYGQCQMYMGKLNLKRTLFIAMDKNTSDLYIEIIEFDEEEFARLVRREEDIIDGLPLSFFPKISNNPSWYTCKFCDAKDVCHQGEMPHKTCRTCENAVVLDEGKWWCNWHAQELSDEDQRAACEHYQLSPVWTSGGGDEGDIEEY